MREAAVLLVIGAFLAAFAATTAVDPSCDYQQTLELGQTYYVYNPGYPNKYRGRNNCRWTAKSDYRVQLDCKEMDLPQSPDCTGDHISIRLSPYETKRFCGNRSFSVRSESETMLINFQSLAQSAGGAFLCRLWAVKKVEYNPNCSCGWKNPTRITGGEETGVNEFPMMAGIVNLEQYRLYCGGTIISYKHVLTAAHCIAGRTIENLVVVVGEHDITTGNETKATRILPIEKATLHPDWKPATAEADIAILLTGRTILYNLQVGPVCLPFVHQFDSFAGSFVELAGWGLLGPTDKKPTALQKVRVSVANEAQCRTDYPGTMDGHICTTGYERDSCQEDSGGPVFWQNPTTNSLALVGIISRGGLCGANTTSLNTRVGYYIDWIVSQTADINYCTTQ